MKTYKEYLLLPKNKRVKWGFWYIYPEVEFMLICNADDHSRLESLIQRRYPIQWFFRRTIPIILHQTKEWIMEWIRPHQQKWLLKKIPRAWMDKPELIEMVVFESFIHYIEQELEDNSYVGPPTEEELNIYKFCINMRNEDFQNSTNEIDSYINKIIQMRGKLWT